MMVGLLFLHKNGLNSLYVSSVHLLLTSWQWATSVVPTCLPILKIRCSYGAPCSSDNIELEMKTLEQHTEDLPL